MASVGIKSFYRQQKKAAGVSGKGSGKLAAAAGSQPLTIVPNSSPDLQEEGEEYLLEQRLRQFDLDARYGPCIGLTRMERWDRASSMGLNPPADVEALLLGMNGGDQAGPYECLFAGRV